MKFYFAATCFSATLGLSLTLPFRNYELYDRALPNVKFYYYQAYYIGR